MRSLRGSRRLRATEALTDCLRAEDDEHVESGLRAGGGSGHCDRRCSDLHSLQGHSSGTRSLGSWHGKHWSTATRPSDRNDSATALQPILATPERCTDAEELKERLTAWSLKVSLSTSINQCKAIYEAQKTFVVREMMPKDIKREFLT